MLSTAVALALCVAAFLWVLQPLFGKPVPLETPDARREIREAVSASLQEFRADLELGKIRPDDLQEIERHLRATSGERD